MKNEFSVILIPAFFAIVFLISCTYSLTIAAGEKIRLKAKMRKRR